MDTSAAPEPFGLYLHIPFCAKKCPYCDFNTYAGLDSLFGDTVDALCRELARWRAVLTGRLIDTIFIGGGTPTVLAERELAALFAAIHEAGVVAPDAEITCEANPGTVDRDKFSTLRALGVNRLSLGVQSFQREELRFLGRIHDVADVYQAVDAARQAGFDNINLDFMFGLPHQAAVDWRATLREAIGLRPAHLSLYSLIVEPDTPLHGWVRSGRVDEPDVDQAAELYEIAMETLDAAGYCQYEVSNWALAATSTPPATPPRDACRHNLIYWRNQEYLGVGPGAHSHLRLIEGGKSVERRWGNRKPVAGYVKRMADGASVEEFHEEISAELSMGETMMLGLRLLREGVELAQFHRRHGRSLTEFFAPQLERLQKADLVTVDDERVRLTRRGLMMGNQVFMDFLPETSAVA